MKNKLFILIFCMVLLVGNVSAFEFDNTLRYENNDMKVTLENAFGLPLFGSELGSAELKSHKSVDEILKFGYGKEEVVMYYDFSNWELYKDGLGEVYFTDKRTGEIIEKDYHFVYWGDKERNVYAKGECFYSVDGKKNCEDIIMGKETYKDWLPYNSKDIPSNNIRIGIKTYIDERDYIDAIWTIAGKKIEKHAEWTASLNVGLISYYKMDDPIGNLTDSLGVNNLTNNGGDYNATGIIKTAIDYEKGDPDTSDGTFSNPPTDEFAISLWVNFETIIGTGGVLSLAPDGSHGIMIYTTTSLLQSYLFNADTISNTPISTGSFIHVVFTRDSSDNVTLYVNGTFIGWKTDNHNIVGIDKLKLCVQGGGANYCDGILDEIGIWNRSLSQAEVTQLYNGGSGISYTDIFPSPPLLTLNSPIEAFNSTSQTINFNGTVTSLTGITNVTLFIDGVLNETNSSGINDTDYLFTKVILDGNHNWTYESCNSEGCTTATTRNFTIDSSPTINVFSPTNTTFNTSTIFFNATSSLTVDDWIVNYNGTNTTLTSINTSLEVEDGDFQLLLYANNSVSGVFGLNDTLFFSVDATAPTINVSFPNETLDFHAFNTNLSVNWTVSDSHLDTCTLEYEGVNTTVTCSANSTNINITNSINKSLTLYVNDTFGNTNSSSVSWDYLVFENSQTFNEIVLEGALETFSANITLSTSKTISTVNLFYNNTLNVGSSSSSGNDSILTIDFTIPTVSTDTNVTFFWNVVLSSGESINLTSHNQTITQISIDDCSSNTVVLYNYTVVDEELQTLLSNTTTELNIDIFDLTRTNSIANFSKLYSNVNPFAVCLNLNLSSTSYSSDSIVKYEAIDYEIEYYNIVNFTLSNSSIPQNITLFDLNSSDSTEFKISFKGEDFIVVENALIFIDRQYIAENNSFKTVELPKTDANGETLGHFVRNDVVYNIRVIKNGIVLGTFNNIIAFCQDFTIGDCQIALDATPGAQETFNYDEELGITFQSVPTYDNSTNTISFSYSAVDGTSKTVFMEVVREDIFGNRTLCNNTVTSASGTLSCSISPNIDDTKLRTKVFVDGKLIVLSTVELVASTFGNLGYVLWFFLTFTFIWTFGSSKTEVLIGLFVSFAGAITLGIARGDIIGIGSAGIWVLVVIILGIWKLNKDNRQ